MPEHAHSLTPSHTLAVEQHRKLTTVNGHRCTRMLKKIQHLKAGAACKHSRSRVHDLKKNSVSRIADDPTVKNKLESTRFESE